MKAPRQIIKMTEKIVVAITTSTIVNPAWLSVRTGLNRIGAIRRFLIIICLI